MTDFNPTHYEETISQIPALHLLIHLGYRYLLPSEAHRLRGQKQSNVILTDILQQFLEKQKFTRLGKKYSFSQKSIQDAIKAIENIEDVGLIQTNQNIWHLLRLGKSFEETYDGGKGDFTLQYIDWQHPENNLYHVTDEFEIERATTDKTCRPDIVLFVNGIPFITIECKRSGLKEDPIPRAINQLREYQQTNYIPHLFHYNQILLALANTSAQYGTVGTPKQFWATWREPEIDNGDDLATLINSPLEPADTDKLFTKDKNRFTNLSPTASRQHYQTNLDHGRTVTEQDKLIYALCRPRRLLELSDRFSLFDAGERKIARYQQYFTVKSILDRVNDYRGKGARNGGVVWHTQGSGKSLTMVFLAEAIASGALSTSTGGALSSSAGSALSTSTGGALSASADETGNKNRAIRNPRIILVTDRVDLDDQIYGTFENCGAALTKATTGKHLRELLDEPKATILTTVIHKFETVINSGDYKNESPDIFVLVDESHRTQFGSFHLAMRRTLPNACFIGFTGTPVQKKNKSTVEKFGGMIQPTYTIRRALEDNAVVPLLYENRFVDQLIDKDNLDRWFDRYTADLTERQKAQLQKRFGTKTQLNEVDSKIQAIAWDISGHFATNWQGRGLKAQLVTQNKASALKYKKYLDEFGKVTSEVLISPPGLAEGDDDLDDDREALKNFWSAMMERFGSPEKYQDNLIKAFKNQDDPEIIIVVDKLLTGFDAPRNTVLYLTRSLRDHRLLQAIARVNRLYEGKEHGVIIDYIGIAKELGAAVNLYDYLEGEYDAGDLEGIMVDLDREWRQIEQHYSDLWAIFACLPNRQDNNAFVELLRDESAREEFQERLSLFGRTLQLALGSVTFFEETPKKTIGRYKQDFKFFIDIRDTAARQYGDTLDFKQHRKTIQNLLDNHVGAREVETLVELVDIFDREVFERDIERFTTPVAKAEAIATRTIHTITEKFGEDETFYQPFSERLEEILRRIREKRYGDAGELLRETRDICDRVRDRNQRDDIPESLRHHEVAQAYYGILYGQLKSHHPDPELSATLALEIDRIIRENRIVNWQQNTDIQNRMKTRIEDCLFETLDEYNIELDFDAIDYILDKCVATATIRLPNA